MEKHMDREKACWEKLTIEGDNLYDYLLNNYESMIDEEDVKHFNITHANGWLIDEANEFSVIHFDKIKKNLATWIKNEVKNDLLKIEFWKPFRDDWNYLKIFLGYRRLFQYEGYMFQLVLFRSCSSFGVGICKECQKLGTCIKIPHFELSLYGWKDKSCKKLQPLNQVSLLDSDLLSESYWFMKN